MGASVLTIVYIVLLVPLGGGIMQKYIYGCTYMLYNHLYSQSEQNERKTAFSLRLFTDADGPCGTNQCYLFVQDTSGMHCAARNPTYP